MTQRPSKTEPQPKRDDYFEIFHENVFVRFVYTDMLVAVCLGSIVIIAHRMLILCSFSPSMCRVCAERVCLFLSFNFIQFKWMCNIRIEEMGIRLEWNPKEKKNCQAVRWSDGMKNEIGQMCENSQIVNVKIID